MKQVEYQKMVDENDACHVANNDDVEGEPG